MYYKQISDNLFPDRSNSSKFFVAGEFNKKVIDPSVKFIQ